MTQTKTFIPTPRLHLPDERPSHTHKFEISGHQGFLHIGLYPDDYEIVDLRGKPGEIFITFEGMGPVVAEALSHFAISVSLLLQYQVPLKEICRSFVGRRSHPSGFTNNKRIPIAKSITDYIFRYLRLKYLGDFEESEMIEGVYSCPNCGHERGVLRPTDGEPEFICEKCGSTSRARPE